MNPILRTSDLQVGQPKSDKIGLQPMNLQGLKAIHVLNWVSDLKCRTSERISSGIISPN